MLTVVESTAAEAVAFFKKRTRRGSLPAAVAEKRAYAAGALERKRTKASGREGGKERERERVLDDGRREI